MKKKIFLNVMMVCNSLLSSAQHFSVANDRQNIAFVGIENPITVAVENVSARSVYVKTDNGIIAVEDGRYIFRPDHPGWANIIVFKKANTKLIEVGKWPFRVHQISDPIFKIGSGLDSIRKVELANQEFARAEPNGDFGDYNPRLDSFTVCIIRIDSFSYVEKINVGNKISDEIKKEFSKLKTNDIVLFKNINAIMPDGKKRKLKSRGITIFENY